MVWVGGTAVGGGAFAVMAGPCSVEGEEMIFATARAVKVAGATMFRGGAFKLRTFFYVFQGLGLDGLKLLRAASDEVGLLVVIEVFDVCDVEMVVEWVDVL